MVRLKSVGVMSVAKISCLLHGGISLLLIPVFLFMAMVMSIVPKDDKAPPAMFFVIFAFIAPFFYAAIGFIVGALGAFFYNLAAGWLGGIEMQFESMVPAVAAPTPPPPQAPTVIDSGQF